VLEAGNGAKDKETMGQQSDIDQVVLDIARMNPRPALGQAQQEIESALSDILLSNSHRSRQSS